MSKTLVVVPSIRPSCHEEFVKKWTPLFEKHNVYFVTVWDGDEPRIQFQDVHVGKIKDLLTEDEQELIYNRTDSVRNAGFLWAAKNRIQFDNVITLDDDVYPLPDTDPIADLIEPLGKWDSISWFNTLLGGEEKVRGFPYVVRAEAQIQISHAGWLEVPDYDGPTQLYLTPKEITEPEKYKNPQFYKGVVPKGCLCCFCGMAVAFTKKAMPEVYYAPMGSAVNLHRFGDIWMGINLKRTCDERNWAIYYGNAMVHHSRASDVFKNLSQESEGLRLNELYWKSESDNYYFKLYEDRRLRYRAVMEKLLAKD
jgi:hypothetical protein